MTEVFGFIERASIPVSNLGSQFAADENSGGCIVEANSSGGHGSVPLGGHEGGFHDKCSNVSNLAWGTAHELEIAIAMPDDVSWSDGSGRDHRHRLTVEERAVAGDRGVFLVEIGQVKGADQQLAVFDEPNRDAPKWLMVGEVARAIDGIHNPVSGFCGRGVPVLFSPEPGSGRELEEFRFQERFDFSVDVGDERCIALDFNLERASAVLGDFGRLAQESDGFAEQGGLIHDWFNYARSLSVPGHPAQFGALGRGCGIFSEPRAGVAQW